MSFCQVDEDEVEALRIKVHELEKGKNNRLLELEGKVEELTNMLKLIYNNPEIVGQIKDRSKSRNTNEEAS